MKPYRLPRRVKGKRTNKLQIMPSPRYSGYGLKAYRQGSLEVEERPHLDDVWLSVIPPARGGAGWWEHTWTVPKPPELVLLAILARYKNYAWDELLDVKEGLIRLFEPFEKGGY